MSDFMYCITLTPTGDILSSPGPNPGPNRPPSRIKVKYSVFHVIVLQEQGCCELVLGLIVSPKASM